MKNNLVQNQTSEVAVINDDQFKQFQSLYYLIKGKRDTDIKLFNDYKQFTFNDIIELNDKIYRKLQLHTTVTDIVNISVGLDKNEIKTFGNWQEFSKTDWNISARTKYVTLEWDFNILLPNQNHQVPQTHTLRIRMGNSLNPSEMIQMVFQGGDEYEYEELQSQMVCKIDFVNAQICSELKSVVGEWYDALQKNSEDHKMIKFILKHEVKIQNFIVLSFLTAGIILCNYIYSFLSKGEFKFMPGDITQRFFLMFTSSLPVLYTFYRAGLLYADRVLTKTINLLRRNPMFEITKGDRNRFTEIADTNKKLLNQLSKNLLFALSANLITYLVGVLLKYISNN